MERSRPLVGRLRRPVAAIAALTIGLSLALSVPPVAQAEPKKTPAVVKTDVREVKPGQQFSTKSLTLKSAPARKAKAKAAGRRHPGGRHHPHAARARRLQRQAYNKSVHAPGGRRRRSRSGWPTTRPSRPATAAPRCANSTTVTRAQAQELADQFDSNMFPKESQAFSVAPDRDGSGNRSSRTSTPPVTATRS